MSEHFQPLLEATIRHLQDLKSQGRRFVSVSPDVVKALFQPGPRSARPTARSVQTAKPVADPTIAPTLPARRIEPRISVSPAALAVVPPTAPLLSPEAKAAAMAELRERAMVCVKCPHLVSSRTQVVFGVGDIHSPIMFVGEAPGADEDQQGEPFVGKAGQLLTRIIQTMGFDRDRVYIANILKCRPDTPGQSAGNRKPTPEEMKTCIPYLHSQIDLIQPKVIIALGATAVEGLLGKTVGITRLRGQWHTYRNIPLMPTYHPAYLLRNQALSEKRRVWEDMLQVLEKLELPISEKQRTYFTKN